MKPMSNIVKFTNGSNAYEALLFEYSTEGIAQLRSFYPQAIYTTKARTPGARGFANLQYKLWGSERSITLLEGSWLIKQNGGFYADNMIMSDSDFDEFYHECKKEQTKEPKMTTFISAKEAITLTNKSINEGTEESKKELRLISNAIQEKASQGKTDVYYGYRVLEITIQQLKKLGYKVKFTDDQREGPSLHVSWK